MYRLLLHVSVGLASVAISIMSWPLALILALYFLSYELNQDRYKRDQVQRDIIGAAWGVAVGGIGPCIVKNYRLIMWGQTSVSTIP